MGIKIDWRNIIKFESEKGNCFEGTLIVVKLTRVKSIKGTQGNVKLTLFSTLHKNDVEFEFVETVKKWNLKRKFEINLEKNSRTFTNK
jgi:hypothetical protein